MRSIRVIGLLIAFAIPSAAESVCAQTPVSKATEIKIGLLEDISKYTEEICACQFSFSASDPLSEPAVMYGIAAESGEVAVMKIDGRVTTLKRISSTWSQQYSKRERKGSSYVETYRSGDMRIRVTYVVLRKDPDAESALYSATIVVTKGSQSKTLKTFGGCACLF